jgi:hypothetical protein
MEDGKGRPYGKMRNADRVLVGEHEGRSSVGRHKRVWEKVLKWLLKD